jgi:DNA-binding CsgD family transcriptional regulator
MSRLNQAERRAQLSCDALDRLSSPILLLDGNARIHYLNAAAHTVLASADGLQSRDQRLEAITPGETSTLHKLIHGATQVYRTRHASSGGCLTITRSDGRTPLQLVVAPLGRSRCATTWPGGDLAIVIVERPEASPPSLRAHLQARFGLTPAESSVALMTADGEGLKSVAERLGLSITTIRTHVHRVFAKTDTRRQAQLAQLLASHPTTMLKDTETRE